MKQLNVLIATIVITAFSMVPAVAKADDHELDDLDVTMDVVDDVEGIDDFVNEMPGPEETELYLLGEDGGPDEESVADAEGEGEGSESEEGGDEGDSEFERQDDEFVTDEDFTEEDEDFREEGEFEEGEDVDTDEFDEPMEEEDDMEEMPEEEIVEEVVE